MRIRTPSVLASLAVGLVLLACSGETTEDGGTTPEAACSDAAKKICAKLASCSSMLVQSVYGTAATCEQRAAIDCVAGLKAQGTTTTGSDIASCASALDSATCGEALAFDPAACRTKAGTLADGAPCAFDGQCTGTNCRKDTGSCGACSTRKGAGSDCKNRSDCTEPLDCIKGTCVQRGASGAACSADTPCELGLMCKGGVCAPALQAGAACDPQSGDACDLLAGLFCNPQSKVCAAVKLVDPGQPCGFVGGTFVGCSASGTCKGAKGTTPGTCLAAAADGQPCDTVNGPDCLPPATCLNKVCTLSDATACH